MTEKNEMESADFFDEVQERVEQDMFLNGALADEGDAVRLKQGADPQPAEAVVENDMDDIEDPDLFEGELDDSLYDEIDAVQSDGTLSEGALEPERAVGADAASLPPGGIDLDSVHDDLSDLREDDLMLGELIDSEMIEPGDKTGAQVEEVSSYEAPSAEDGAHLQGEGRDVLDTKTLGDLYASQGLYAKAVAIYEKLAAETPSDRKLLERLGELRLQAARESFEPLPPDDRVASGSAPESRPDPQMVLVKRLEAWLDYIQAEKERRCSKSS